MTSGAPMGDRAPWYEALLTYIRGLIATALAAALAVLTTSGHFPSNGTEWRALLWAVLVATVPVIIVALDPHDSRYGRGSTAEAAHA